MSLLKIYKISILAVFIVLVLFRIQIGYSNKINTLRKEVTDLKVSNSMLLADMNYMSEIKKSFKNTIQFDWPMAVDDYERLTDWYGLRDIPRQIYTGGSPTRFHSGIDIKGYEKARIIAIADGIVVEHWLPTGYHNGVYYSGDPILGGKIIIDHQNGWFSVYGHMDFTYVKEGQIVKKGETIGRQGNTGMSTGPHLHFELWDDWEHPVQPLEHIKDPNYY